MSKYIDADRLRLEIEKTYKSEIAPWLSGVSAKSAIYDYVMPLIDSLQREQPASKMERLNVDILRDWSMRYAPGFREMIEDTAYHFWNLALSARKEQPEVDLEKEVRRWKNKHGIVGMDDVWIEFALHFYELGLNARKEK